MNFGVHELGFEPRALRCSPQATSKSLRALHLLLFYCLCHKQQILVQYSERQHIVIVVIVIVIASSFHYPNLRPKLFVTDVGIFALGQEIFAGILKVATQMDLAPFRTNIRMFSPHVIGCYFWNSIPLGIRQTSPMHSLKKSLYRCYLVQYQFPFPDTI